MNDIVKIETISQVHDFFQYPKPKHPLISVLPINDTMTNYDYGDYSYTFGFYQISLKSGMSGSMTYGRNSYDFQEGTMTFIKPNQVIKIEDQRELQGARGWTLLFHPDLIRVSELGKNITEYSFFNYESNEALHLSDEEKKSLTELITKIETEYNQNIDEFSQELIISNIDLLLKYCKRYYNRQFLTRTNLNKGFVTKFESVLEQYFSSDKVKDLGILTVNYCARELNMSANYLGDLLKSETGTNAKDHIQNFIVDKAKTMLLTTAKSVSEIAYEFGFEYPQSFNKLFKSKTGYTPTQYRKAS